MAPDLMLTAAQTEAIIADCIFQTTGSRDPIGFGKTLQQYGFDIQDQIDVFVGLVCGDPVNGVRRFNFTLDPQTMVGLTTGSTLATVGALILNNAKSA
jgi:hypothetical protein